MRRAFSAPGKALLAGGYLVLDPAYNAYVVALSVRMHAIVATTNRSGERNGFTITVNSPQFKEGHWVYYSSDTVSKTSNPFINSTIDIIKVYVGEEKWNQSKNIEITIFSDDGYHSQKDSTPKVVGQRKFHFHQKPISEVPKTGMGSSAALTVVFCTALLSSFMSVSLQGEENQLSLIHNLSQIAHCRAQGKIGSGFDVGSATFGSIIYRRFTPELISKFLDHNVNPEELRVLVTSQWDMQTQPCTLPEGLTLLMGDVAGGSETPKMVSTVLKWRKENPALSSEIWGKLNAANQKLMNIFQLIQNQNLQNKPCGLTLESYNDDLRETMIQIRSYLRDMTHYSTASIEPEEQTTLIDKCLATLPNDIIGGVVPGAGGYDAICILVKEKSVKEFMEKTRDLPINWLDLTQENHGLAEEDPQCYL